ncbi:MAG: hypothetical protein OXR66_04980 [Candidatus Woesearchaeota archaeon]|nr:hypothetical protein [Candidatus Woesearchaeota archaeon]
MRKIGNINGGDLQFEYFVTAVGVLVPNAGHLYNHVLPRFLTALTGFPRHHDSESTELAALVTPAKYNDLIVHFHSVLDEVLSITDPTHDGYAGMYAPSTRPMFNTATLRELRALSSEQLFDFQAGELTEHYGSLQEYQGKYGTRYFDLPREPEEHVCDPPRIQEMGVLDDAG